MSTGHQPNPCFQHREYKPTCPFCYGKEVPPPSEGGPPFTLAEIDESIRLMERRLETGQGTRASAMCRLSLDAAKALRGMVTDAQADVDRRSAALGEANKERRRLESEVSHLRSRVTVGDFVSYKGKRYRVETARLCLDSSDNPTVDIRLMIDETAPMVLQINDGWVAIGEVTQ